MPREPLRCSAMLTHHWLVRRRGGERVLEALGELLPAAALATLVHDPAWNEHSRVAVLNNRPVMTSFLQRLPGATRSYPKFLPLMPLAARRMKLPPVDLVVCSDAAIAKAMTADPRSKLVCYCHSPMRYVWEPEISRQYAQTLPAGLRPLWPRLCAYVREQDRRAAQRVDAFVANSRTVAERIHRCYGRESQVVHPPVDLPAGPAVELREDFYLCVGYHVAYKRLDLAVEACRQLGRKLVVLGDGPEVRRLRDASPCATFLGHPSDESIQSHYRRARGLLFPGEEDFGIVPVEAMAHGCPVIAFGRGGATETVRDGQSGVLFPEQTAESLAGAIQRFEALHFEPRALHEWASNFSRERFLQAMRAVLQPHSAGHDLGAAFAP